MSKRKKDSDSPITVRAQDLHDWLDDMNDKPGFVRWILVRWYRERIISTAMEALEALAKGDKALDKGRRAAAIIVSSLGGWDAIKKLSSGGKED